MNDDFDIEEPSTVDESPGIVWVEKEVVRSILVGYDPEIVQQDRAPLWAVVTADAYCCTASFMLTDRTPESLLNQVKDDETLKQAVVTGFRMGAAAVDIIDMITNWEGAQS